MLVELSSLEVKYIYGRGYCLCMGDNWRRTLRAIDTGTSRECAASCCKDPVVIGWRFHEDYGLGFATNEPILSHRCLRPGEPIPPFLQ